MPRRDDLEPRRPTTLRTPIEPGSNPTRVGDVARPVERARRGRHRALARHRLRPHRRDRVRARRVDARRHLQLRQRGAQHRLRAAARRRAHRDARAAVREVLRVATTTTRASAIFTVAIVALAGDHRRSASLARAVDRRPLHAQRRRARTSPTQQELATALLRLFMPQMLFYGIAALATAMLNARRRFLAAAFAPDAQQRRSSIAVFLMLPRVADGDAHRRRACSTTTRSILLIGLGTTAGVVVMALALLPAAGAPARVTCASCPRGATPRCARCCGSRGGRSGYVIANQIALLVVTVLANGTDGGPFVYISAYAFFQLPHGLFAVSLMTTFTPELATRGGARRPRRAARAAVARAPAHRDRDRARRRDVHRARAPDHRRAAAARRVLRRRRGRRSPTRSSRSRSGLLPVLHLPVRAACVLRRATTRSRRSGSTASRTR